MLWCAWLLTLRWAAVLSVAPARVSFLTNPVVASPMQMPKELHDVKIAILTCPFEPPKPKTKHKARRGSRLPAQHWCMLTWPLQRSSSSSSSSSGSSSREQQQGAAAGVAGSSAAYSSWAMGLLRKRPLAARRSSFRQPAKPLRVPSTEPSSTHAQH